MDEQREIQAGSKQWLDEQREKQAGKRAKHHLQGVHRPPLQAQMYPLWWLKALLWEDWCRRRYRFTNSDQTAGLSQLAGQMHVQAALNLLPFYYRPLHSCLHYRCTPSAPTKANLITIVCKVIMDACQDAELASVRPGMQRAKLTCMCLAPAPQQLCSQDPTHRQCCFNVSLCFYPSLVATRMHGAAPF